MSDPRSIGRTVQSVSELAQPPTPLTSRPSEAPVFSLPPVPQRFDRERIVLYVASAAIVVLVLLLYLLGYLIPALDYGRAIVHAADASPEYPRGCYLLFMEHANRLQSAYAIRFLGMLIGIAVTFVGMVFTIKGLETGYSLDVASGGNSASLKTASPGLVLCTFGLVLVAASVLHSAELTFENVVQCLQ